MELASEWPGKVKWLNYPVNEFKKKKSCEIKNAIWNPHSLMESESSSLPWHWVIEALAGFKEITLPTLQALIDASPLTHHDFSETTKDLIALKCLEELYPSSSSTTTLKELDSSLSSQDVLNQILRQVTQTFSIFFFFMFSNFRD